MNVEDVYYELRIVSAEEVETEAHSPRRAVVWRQRVRVDRLMHSEPIPRGIDPTAPEHVERYRQRIGQFIRGAAWEQFLEHVKRSAMSVSVAWLALNLEPGEYVMLFSTRKQAALAERLGQEAGIWEADRLVFHLRTDRRLPGDVCYCFRAHGHRIYARYEFGRSLLRIFLSDVLRLESGSPLVQLEADAAIRYLRAITRNPAGRLPAPEPRAPLDTTEPIAVTGSAPVHAALPVGGFSHPATFRRRASIPSEWEDEPTVIETEDAGASVPDRCPKCGGTIFRLSETRAFCRTCDWNNLPPIGSRD